MSDKCPNCGYHTNCGRQDAAPYNPWQPYVPYIMDGTTSSGSWEFTVSDSTDTLTNGTSGTIKLTSS